jgi:hypothetical protein
MLNLDDRRWSDLTGGYRTLFDPRPLLAKLETGQDAAVAWHGLWEELHHQGDVGEASYAAVPHLVRIHRKLAVVEHNAYAMVALIELARKKSGNPELPKWLEEDYFAAIRELAEIGAVEILRTQDLEVVRAILGVLALAKGLRIHGKFLVEYSEDELLYIESRA